MAALQTLKMNALFSQTVSMHDSQKGGGGVGMWAAASPVTLDAPPPTPGSFLSQCFGHTGAGMQTMFCSILQR